ncbi:hypothetical protein ACHAQJ_001648 [Trichoderma viride]
MHADEIQRELEEAPGITTDGLSDEGQRPRLRSQIHTMVNDGENAADSSYELPSNSSELDEEYSSGSGASESDTEAYGYMGKHPVCY